MGCCKELLIPRSHAASMSQHRSGGVSVDTGAMRLIAALMGALLLVSGCMGGDEANQPAQNQITLDSLDLDWPQAAGELDPVDPPDAPAGFDQTRYGRMVDALTTWANATTLDPEVRESDDPAAAVGSQLPKAVGSQLNTLGSESVSPHLAVANVFADDVTVLGQPRITTAWRAEAVERDGAPALSLQLQTRAAYEVRLGEDGPKRVIGVLRVHELVTRAGETGDIGIGFGWQEFGASDCTLALDDALRPDGDIGPTKEDLAIFVEAGSGDTVEMPDLGEGETVDQDYLDRCRAGQV